MKTKWFQLPLILICFSLPPALNSAAATESLADAARRESERRKEVDRLGIEETVIIGNGRCSAREGNVTISDPSEIKPLKDSSQTSSPKNSSSLRQYRTTLQKMDRDIRKNEARLEKLRDRLQDLRRKNLTIRDISKIGKNEESRDQTQAEIEALQDELKQQRRERMEVYDSGKKDGFLPGELEGKGIIP